jgi:hypothetical protein
MTDQSPEDRVAAVERGLAALTERVERLEAGTPGGVLVYNMGAVELEDLSWFGGPKVPVYGDQPPLAFVPMFTSVPA